jgi:hypothetical protein
VDECKPLDPGRLERWQQPEPRHGVEPGEEAEAAAEAARGRQGLTLVPFQLNLSRV